MCPKLVLLRNLDNRRNLETTETEMEKIGPVIFLLMTTQNYSGIKEIDKKREALQTNALESRRRWDKTLK